MSSPASYFFCLDFKLVKSSVECLDDEEHGKLEISKGKVSSLEQCAKACADVSSLFIYGKKGSKSTACDDGGCSCICEVSVDSNDECLKEKEVDTFDLYRYVKRGMTWFNISFKEMSDDISNRLIFG